MVHEAHPRESRGEADLQTNQSIGVHFGTFQLTDEGVELPVKELNAALKEKGLESSSFVTVREGVARLVR